MKRVDFDESNELGRLMSNSMPNELMPKHDIKLQFFSYRDPVLAEGKRRAVVRLCTTDVVVAAVQKLLEGGEATMHYHEAMDGFWMVLKGRASFLDLDGDEHEVGPLEGLMIPRGAAYAFRTIGDEPLQILQVEALYPGMRNTVKVIRDKHNATEDRTPDMSRLAVVELYDGRIEEI